MNECVCVSVCASLFLLQESWDYVGSSRMVYDMNNGVFPFARDKDKQVRPHPPPGGETAPTTSWLFMYISSKPHQSFFICCPPLVLAPPLGYAENSILLNNLKVLMTHKW